MKLDASAFVAEPELINLLKAHSTPIDCSEDRTLFNQGDAPVGFYIFHAGEVLLTMKTPYGETVMSMLAANNSLLGLPGLIGNVGYSLSASARKGADVSYVSRDEFSRLMLSDPAISMSILRVLAAEVRTARIALAAA